jgi:hypothetical protein
MLQELVGAEAVIGVVLVGHFLNTVAQKWGKGSGDTARSETGRSSTLPDQAAVADKAIQCIREGSARIDQENRLRKTWSRPDCIFIHHR